MTEIEAQDELSRIQGASAITHVLLIASQSQFPVFIAEDNGFHFLELSELLARVGSTSPVGNVDHVHFNVYAFTKSFRPAVPGRDEMGSLLHWHVSDATLREPRASVFKQELLSFTSDA